MTTEGLIFAAPGFFFLATVPWEDGGCRQLVATEHGDVGERGAEEEVVVEAHGKREYRYSEVREVLC